MTPRSIIRWKSFWFGILVLGFLGWAWVRSMKVREGVAFVNAESRLILSHSVGHCELFVAPGWYEKTGPELFSGEPMPWNIVKWFQPWAAIERPTVEEGSLVQVAHWLLILLFLIPWSAFLAWRWRRQNLTKAHDAPPAP